VPSCRTVLAVLTMAWMFRHCKKQQLTRHTILLHEGSEGCCLAAQAAAALVGLCDLMSGACRCRYSSCCQKPLKTDSRETKPRYGTSAAVDHVLTNLTTAVLQQLGSTAKAAAGPETPCRAHAGRQQQPSNSP
jgi:hypothetical protein